MLYVERLWKKVPNKESSFEKYYKKYRNKILQEGVPVDLDGSLYKKTNNLYYEVLGIDPVLGIPKSNTDTHFSVDLIALLLSLLIVVLLPIWFSDINADTALVFAGIFMVLDAILSFFEARHSMKIAAQCKVVIDILKARKPKDHTST